jgi:4-hydroxy-tetrahydrodipicolinate reductase
MRLLVVGHGRMGRLVEQHAAVYGFEVAAALDVDDNPGGAGITAERCRGVDVAMDFSTPEATLATVPKLAALGVNLVVGTTGWQAREAELREAVRAAGIGAVVSANFSLAANLLDALSQMAGRLFAPAESYGAFIHEAHHRAKKDAPSGTALMLRRALERGGYGSRSTSARPAPAGSRARTRSASTGPRRRSRSCTRSVIAPPSPTARSRPRAGSSASTAGSR